MEKNIEENKIEIKNLKEEISKLKTSQTKNPCRENPAMDNTILQEINDKGNHIKRYTEEINIRLNHQTDTESQQEQVDATLTQQYAETLKKQHQTAPNPPSQDNDPTYKNKNDNKHNPRTPKQGNEENSQPIKNILLHLEQQKILIIQAETDVETDKVLKFLENIPTVNDIAKLSYRSTNMKKIIILGIPEIA